MDKINDKDLEWLTQSPEKFKVQQTLRYKEVKKRTFRRRILKFATSLLIVIALGILPFFILIRTAVYLNLAENFNGWISLLGGIGASTLLLGFYLLFLFRKVKKKKLLLQYGLGGLGALVGGFCIYGLLYLSSVNAKTENVRDVYRSLHPILRVAIATTTLADSDILITDIMRTPEDYKAMGLTPRQTSLHYEQDNGFVHAIDLRTIGHSEIRNKSLEWSLNAMGLHTIRHVGTADHLHVALPVKK